MSLLWHGHNKFKSIEAIGPTSGFGDFEMPFGQSRSYGKKVFFVDPTNGNDNNNGQSWRYAFATFEAAIDEARYSHGTTDLNYDADQRAFIFLGPGHYDETTQLLWSGYNISVIGCVNRPGKDYGVSFNYSGNTSATAVMLINGSGNGLYNLHFYCDAALPVIYLYFPGDNNLIKDCIIECDTNTTYGIYTTTMKGSLIEGCTVFGAFATAGIGIHYDAADQYAINGGVKDCKIYGSGSNVSGITVHANLVCYNFWLEHNFVELRTGSSCKGIDVNATAGVMVVDNYVSVPSSATAIEHAGGEQYQMGNHTAAGTTNVDPSPAAG